MSPPRADMTEDVAIAHTLKASDFYKVLLLQPDATQDDVKINYRRLSRRLHPDKAQASNERAVAAFQRLGEAYTVLSNPAARFRYDEERKVACTAAASNREKAGTPGRRDCASASHAPGEMDEAEMRRLVEEELNRQDASRQWQLISISLAIIAGACGLAALSMLTAAGTARTWSGVAGYLSATCLVVMLPFAGPLLLSLIAVITGFCTERLAAAAFVLVPWLARHAGPLLWRAACIATLPMRLVLSMVVALSDRAMDSATAHGDGGGSGGSRRKKKR